MAKKAVDFGSQKEKPLKADMSILQQAQLNADSLRMNIISLQMNLIEDINEFFNLGLFILQQNKYEYWDVGENLNQILPNDASNPLSGGVIMTRKRTKKVHVRLRYGFFHLIGDYGGLSEGLFWLVRLFI